MITSLLLELLGNYMGCGLVFGVFFVVRGMRAAYPEAPGGTWGFKIVILPGCATFWPFLLGRWLKHRAPNSEKPDQHSLKIKK